MKVHSIKPINITLKDVRTKNMLNKRNTGETINNVRPYAVPESEMQAHRAKIENRVATLDSVLRPQQSIFDKYLQKIANYGKKFFG